MSHLFTLMSGFIHLFSIGGSVRKGGGGDVLKWLSSMTSFLGRSTFLGKVYKG